MSVVENKDFNKETINKTDKKYLVKFFIVFFVIATIIVYLMIYLYTGKNKISVFSKSNILENKTLFNTEKESISVNDETNKIDNTSENEKNLNIILAELKQELSNNKKEIQKLEIIVNKNSQVNLNSYNAKEEAVVKYILMLNSILLAITSNKPFNESLEVIKNYQSNNKEFKIYDLLISIEKYSKEGILTKENLINLFEKNIKKLLSNYYKNKPDFLHNKILWGMSKFIVFYKESEEYIDNNDIKDTISNVLFLLKNEQYKEAIIEIDKIENSENILVDIKNHINSRILANELLNSINFDSVKELVKDVK